MRSFSCTGYILKRHDTGEADRILTIFTKELGKITAIAKGCRKLTSSRASALEPGTCSKIYCVSSHGLPIITQAQIVSDHAPLRTSLVSLRKAFEILEMVDALIDGETPEPQVFAHLEAIFAYLVAPHHDTTLIRERIGMILEVLGVATQDTLDPTQSLRDMVETVTERRLHSYAYLARPV